MKCRYIVKEDERKVICILTVEDLMSVPDFSIFSSDFCNLIMYYKNPRVYKKMKLPRREYVGVATCHNDDEWNEETGKQLAYARARYKYDDAFFKRANLMVNEMDNEVNELYTELNKYGDKLSKNHRKRLDKLEGKLGKEVRIV